MTAPTIDEDHDDEAGKASRGVRRSWGGIRPTPPLQAAVRTEGWLAFRFIAPNLALFTVFVLVPIVLTVGLSFFEWNLLDSPKFVGFGNYAEIIDDERAHNSMLRTLAVMLGMIPTVLIGFHLAALINVRFRYVEAWRTLYYMPIVVSFAASATLWGWVFAPNTGVFNWALAWFGIEGPLWLSSSLWATPAIIVILTWLSLPLVILLYLAALQGIPESVIEASLIDGANGRQRLWKIMWPMVRSATTVVVVVMILAFALGSFDLVVILTQGGPLDSTNVLVYYMFDNAFNKFRMGYAAALAIFQFVAVFGVAAGVIFLVRDDSAV